MAERFLGNLRVAKNQAAVYGNQAEKDIVEESLADLEKEIEEGEEDKLRAGLFLVTLLAILERKRKRLP